MGALALAALSIVVGRAGGALSGSRPFSSGVNLVEVYAAVTDRDGHPVTGLSRDDFTVLEDGQAADLSAFTAGIFPSRSRWRSIGASAWAGVSCRSRARRHERSSPASGPGDQAMVVAIGSAVEVVAPLSTDRQGQQNAVARLQPWGTTGLYDAILQSIDAIQGAKGRRALVLLSDGTDRYSQATAAEARDRARRSDVMVYPIALGRERPPLFAELATLTGGRSFHPKDAQQLTDTMQSIVTELRAQYLVGYVPSRRLTPGEEQWRAITVRLKRADVTVRARDGYFGEVVLWAGWRRPDGRGGYRGHPPSTNQREA